MKVTVVILDQFINFENQEDIKINDELRFRGEYTAKEVNQNIVEHFTQLILSVKGDGVAIELLEFSQDDYMLKIELIHGLEDISFIIEELNRVFTKSNNDKITNANQNMFNGILNIGIHDNKNENERIEILDFISSVFNEHNIEYRICNKRTNRFEHGAGGESVSILIGVFTVLTPIIKDKIQKKLEERKKYDLYIKYGEFNIEKLYLNLAREIKDINVKRFKIKSFIKTESGEYHIDIGNKDIKYLIICDSDSNIQRIAKTTYYI